MNAGLNKEQIEYIQSIVGKTEWKFEKCREDYTEEEFNKKFCDTITNFTYRRSFEDFESNSDEYWQDLITTKGKCIEDLVEETFDWYSIGYGIFK